VRTETVANKIKQSLITTSSRFVESKKVRVNQKFKPLQEIYKIHVSPSFSIIEIDPMNETFAMNTSPINEEPVMSRGRISEEPVMSRGPISEEPVMSRGPISEEPVMSRGPISEEHVMSRADMNHIGKDEIKPVILLKEMNKCRKNKEHSIHVLLRDVRIKSDEPSNVIETADLSNQSRSTMILDGERCGLETKLKTVANNIDERSSMCAPIERTAMNQLSDTIHRSVEDQLSTARSAEDQQANTTNTDQQANMKTRVAVDKFTGASEEAPKYLFANTTYKHQLAENTDIAAAKNQLSNTTAKHPLADTTAKHPLADTTAKDRLTDAKYINQPVDITTESEVVTYMHEYIANKPNALSIDESDHLSISGRPDQHVSVENCLKIKVHPLTNDNKSEMISDNIFSTRTVKSNQEPLICEGEDLSVTFIDRQGLGTNEENFIASYNLINYKNVFSTETKVENKIPIMKYNVRYKVNGSQSAPMSEGRPTIEISPSLSKNSNGIENNVVELVAGQYTEDKRKGVLEQVTEQHSDEIEKGEVEHTTEQHSDEIEKGEVEEVTGPESGVLEKDITMHLSRQHSDKIKKSLVKHVVGPHSDVINRSGVKHVAGQHLDMIPVSELKEVAVQELLHKTHESSNESSEHDIDNNFYEDHPPPPLPRSPTPPPLPAMPPPPLNADGDMLYPFD